MAPDTTVPTHRGTKSWYQQPDHPQRGHTERAQHSAGSARVFTRAHHLDPTAARPLVERSAIAILQHRYDEALADYQRAQQLEPHYPGLASYFAEL